MTALLTARSLNVEVAGTRVCFALDFTVASGQCWAILGRNGAGKTTLLSTLAGLRKATSGTIELDGRAMTSFSPRELARFRALLPQDDNDAFPATALETVLIGRHPHLSLWQWESAEDERLAREALRAVDLEEFATRRTDTLSGGEQRRVAIAALLAQQPGIFLLDEPTNHLDPHHQLAILSLFRALADSGRTVITTLHDPTLAARFADRVLLLHGDGRWVLGPVGTTLTAASLSELYVVPMIELGRDGRRVFVSA